MDVTVGSIGVISRRRTPDVLQKSAQVTYFVIVTNSKKTRVRKSLVTNGLELFERSLLICFSDFRFGFCSPERQNGKKLGAKAVDKIKNAGFCPAL
jgi:hypothetical protein